MSVPSPPLEQFITKVFLENALQAEAEGRPSSSSSSSSLKIKSYSVSQGTNTGDNYMSLIYSVELQLEDGNRRHFVLKCYPNHPARQDLNNRLNVFYKEMKMYTELLPQLKKFQEDLLRLEDVLPLPFPYYVHGQAIDYQSSPGQSQGTTAHSLDNYIILEDLRPARKFKMIKCQDTLDIEHLRLAITALAQLHSVSWAYRAHVLSRPQQSLSERFPFLRPPIGEKGAWVNFQRTNLDLCKGIFDEEFGEGNEYSEAAERAKDASNAAIDFFMGVEGAGPALAKYLKKPGPPPAEGDVEWRVLSHGDCMSNNMLFRYDELLLPVQVVLVDLQFSFESCPTADLQYLLATGTDGRLRAAHTEELLQLYHDKTVSFCSLLKTPLLPGFSMESLSSRFHGAKPFGYFMATLALPVHVKGEEEEEEGGASGGRVNMEELEEDLDIHMAMKALSSYTARSGGNNSLKKRIIEITRDFINDGVL